MKTTLKKFSILLLAFSAICLQNIYGDIVVKSGEYENNRVFGLRFETDKQEFFGRVDKINSISSQNYVTGTFEVQEIVIDFEGSDTQLRIYHTKPYDPTKATQKAMEGSRVPGVSGIQRISERATTKAYEETESVNDAMNLFVMKEYPVTTHSKTLEFRVKSESDIRQLFRELRHRWIVATGKEFETAHNASQNKTTSAGDKLEQGKSLNGVLIIIQ